jgi:hypothetical protein
MPWKRYLPGLAAAVPLGALIGAGIGSLTYAAGLGWGSPSAMLETGAVVGALEAGSAVVGGIVGVAIVHRRAAHSSVVAGSTGASVGAAAPWVILGVILLVAGGGAYVPAALVFAVLSGLIAGALSACSMLLADQISRRQPGGVLRP